MRLETMIDGVRKVSFSKRTKRIVAEPFVYDRQTIMQSIELQASAELVKAACMRYSKLTYMDDCEYTNG